MQLNRYLSLVARAYPHTKFLRALATEVDFAAMSEQETLPTLLIYRRGHLEHSFVRVDQEMDSITEQAVVSFLSRSFSRPQKTSASAYQHCEQLECHFWTAVYGAISFHAVSRRLERFR